MKAERRHELKENDLAAMLESARAFLDKNGRQLSIGIIVVAVVATAVLLVVRSRTAAVEDLWRRKAQLSFEDPQAGKASLEALANLTREASDRQFVLIGLMDQAQAALQLSQESPLPPDPELNQSARRAFVELLQRFPQHPIALGVAHSGLATVEENAFVLDGDLAHRDEAKSHLEAVVNDVRLAGLPVQQAAKDRLDRLDEVFRRVTFEYAPPPLPEPAGPPADAAAAPTTEPAEVDAVDSAEIEGVDEAEEVPVEPATADADPG